MTRTSLPALLCIALLAMSSSCLAQKVVSTLTGLRVAKREVAFDTPVRVVAQRDAAATARWADPRDSIWLRVVQIQNVELPPSARVWVRTKSAAILTAQKTARWQLEGEMKDAVDFGGETRFSFSTTKATPLTGSVAPSAPASKRNAAPVVVGGIAEIEGTLWSMNGEWWFDSGEDVILADARGRQRTFPTNWHGHKATVRGLAKRQLRGPLRAGSGSDPDDELRMYLVVFDATVTLAAGNADVGENGRFRVLADTGPRLRDGVFDLLPIGNPVRNHLGNRTSAEKFVARNWPYLQQIVRDATASMLDVVATRMNDTERHAALRSIYAGVLAAHDDVRGRDYLLAQIAKAADPDQDALYVMGVFDLWNEQKPCGRAWAEAAILRTLQTAPCKVLGCTDACGLLVRIGSEASVRQMLELYLTPEKLLDDTSDWFRVSRETMLLLALLDADEGLLTGDMLVRMSRSRAKDHDNQRRIAAEMLRRDAVGAVDLFLPQIAEGFWYSTFREHAGPSVLAEIKRRMPQLDPEVAFEADMLVASSAPDGVEQLVARLRAPSTKPSRLSRLCWELRNLDGGSKGAVAAAQFLKQRILTGQGQPGIDEFAVRRVLRFIGTSSELAAVAEMVALLDADFRGVASEFVSAAGMRNCIAAQLAEMTGESFGAEAKDWRHWLRLR